MEPNTMRCLLLLLFFISVASSANAQTSVLPCYRTATGCTDISIAHPMPSTISNAADITIGTVFPGNTPNTVPWLISTCCYSARQVYRVASLAYAGYTSATDLACIYGSATKLVRVWLADIGGHAQSTSQYDIVLVKRSSANSGGTPTLLPGVPLDSTYAAPTATFTTYASAPSLGTAVGNVAAVQVSLNAIGGAGASQSSISFGQNIAPLTLRGTSEGACFNAGGTTPPNGMALTADVEWTEE